MTDYFGGQTSYSYDALGRLTSLSNPFGEVTTFQYDANSRLIRKNLANGTYTTYSYNSRGFLTGIYNYKSNGTLLTYATYTYDAVGNRLSMSTPEGNYTYSYDAIYRLTGEVNPIGGTYSYTYDAVGNRLSMTHNGQTINYVYDAGNKLLQAGNTTFTYDGNGNMVSKTENGQTTTYVYNYEDKMVQVNLPNGSSIVYSYDHSGKRIAKTAGGTTIDYYFDGDDLITEAQGANILAYYTQGQGLISQRRNNASYFYHYDGLGSTKALTDTYQMIQASYVYNLLGEILLQQEATLNPFKYAGADNVYKDQDVDLNYVEKGWYTKYLTGDVVLSTSQSIRGERCPSWYPEWACAEWQIVKKACGGINAALPPQKIKERCENCCKTLSDLYSRYDTGNVVVTETSQGPFTRAQDCYVGCYKTCTDYKSGSLAIRTYSECSKTNKCIDIGNQIIGFLKALADQIKKLQEQAPPRPPF
jgi:YD repeat-containing protein